MSMKGTYVNKTLNAKLDITAADNSNGKGSGTFSIGGKSFGVDLHYHFEGNTGLPTVLQIWSNQSTLFGWEYVAASGSTPDQGNSGIRLAGGYSTVNGTTGFSGLFTK